MTTLSVRRYPLSIRQCRHLYQDSDFDLDPVGGFVGKIMKPAIHRSLTFWSGILVMSFICWAWRDSMGNRTMWCAMHVVGENYQSAVTTWPAKVKDQPGLYRLPASAYPVQEKEYFPAPFLRRGEAKRHRFTPQDRFTRPKTLRGKSLKFMEGQETGFWMIFVPHWLILLVTGIAWVGLLILRSRRARSLPRPPSEAVAGEGAVAQAGPTGSAGPRRKGEDGDC